MEEKQQKTKAQLLYQQIKENHGDLVFFGHLFGQKTR